MLVARKALSNVLTSPKGAAAIRMAHATAPLPKHIPKAIKSAVESTIKDNRVIVFSKTWCPHSQRAKGVFAQDFPTLNVKVLELDEIEEGPSIQAYLLEKTGQRTVPSIFIDQQHLGGCSDIMKLSNQGKLAGILGVYKPPNY